MCVVIADATVFGAASAVAGGVAATCTVVDAATVVFVADITAVTAADVDVAGAVDAVVALVFQRYWTEAMLLRAFQHGENWKLVHAFGGGLQIWRK